MKKRLSIILVLVVLLLSGCVGTQEAGLREYSFGSAEDVENISDDDLIYIVQHDYEFGDFAMEPPIRDVDLFDVPLCEYKEKGVVYKEEMLMVPFKKDADEKIDLDNPISEDALKNYADSYCKHMLESADSYNGDTGRQVKDEEIIYCGENDFYIEYSIRYTEVRIMYQNNFRTETEIPRAYRIFFLKNIVSVADDNGTYKAYIGNVTKEAIRDEMDVFVTGNSIPVIYREVTETDENVVYTYYEAYISGGDYGMCDSAVLVKNENIYNKLTHEETHNETYIKKTGNSRVTS